MVTLMVICHPIGIGLGADMDPGYCTQFDSHSNSSSDVVSHPPHPSQTTESPPVAPRTRVPLYPHGTQGINVAPSCCCQRKLVGYSFGGGGGCFNSYSKDGK